MYKNMLQKPRYVGFVFQHKNGLTQTVCPRPAADSLLAFKAARNH
jgi:hypothetical protein